MREGSATVREQVSKPLDPLPHLPYDLGLIVSSNHPEDGVGVLVQSELDAEDQRSTQKRFHCFHMSEEELAVFIKAAKRAVRSSKSVRKEYFRDMEEPQSANAETLKPSSTDEKSTNA